MPYQPIQLASFVPIEVASLINEKINPFLEEIRFLFTIQKPDQGPKGSLHRSLLILLLAAADGASQLLYQGGKKTTNGKKFQNFIKENFPWELDAPDGLTKDDACKFLWEEVRCPLFHRYSLRIKTNQADFGQTKFGRIFTTDDERLTQLEQLTNERPYSDPTFRRDKTRTVIWIDSFYWALRIAIVRSLNTPEKASAIRDWILSGEWDPKTK
jgi:hypothetical protein